MSNSDANHDQTATTEVAIVKNLHAPLGIELVSAANVCKISDHTDLVDLARQVQLADEFVRANATNKLTVIAEQMKYLQEQAKKILQDAQRDSDLNHVACNLVKRPGTTYYLYFNEMTNQRYFSLLSPQEWGENHKQPFLGGYRLELDRSWTPVVSGDDGDSTKRNPSDVNYALMENIFSNSKLRNISDS